MKLLLDHNLSPRLVSQLKHIFPEISHVAVVGLERATDIEVWEYATNNKCAIVSKDSDFNTFSTLFGFPPKVIHLKVGNCTTAYIEEVLRAHQEVIHQFVNDKTAGFLSLGSDF